MQHQRKQNGGIITWDTSDWRAGLGAQGAFGTSFGVKQTDTQGWKTLSKIDPFRLYGILTPAMAPNAFTNGSILSGAVVAYQIYNNTLMTGISSGGVVHRMSYSGSSPAITNDTGGTGYPHTITGSSLVGQDQMFYVHNNNGARVLSLFYSYYNSTNWDVGANVNVNTSVVGTFDDDYMSTIPAGETGPGTVSPQASTALVGVGTSFLTTFQPGDTILVAGETTRVIASVTDNLNLTVTVAFSTTAVGQTYKYFPNAQRVHPHPLCIGSDGVLYIGSGNKLHGYDGSVGANGTFYSSLLVFAQGFEIIAIRKYNDSLLIAGNYSPSSTTATADGSGEALVYVWNYLDENTTQVIPLEDPYVSALFIYRGNPTVITNGIQERNGVNKIKVITGISTTKIADFDGVIPIQRGIVVADDVLYMNAGGKILSYGDKYNKSDAINHIGTCSTSSVSGFLAYNFSNSSLMGSANNGSSTSVVNDFANAGTDSGSLTSFSYQVPLPNGKRGRVVSVQVQYYQTVASNVNNGALSMSLITDFGTTTALLSSISSIVNPLIKKYRYTSASEPLPHFTTIGFSSSFTSSTIGAVPTISTVEVEYEDSDIQSNTLI